MVKLAIVEAIKETEEVMFSWTKTVAHEVHRDAAPSCAAASSTTVESARGQSAMLTSGS